MKEREITAYLRGGLGNQCFVYAAARALALRTHSRLRFNIDSLLEDKVYKRRLALNAFNCALGEVEVRFKPCRVFESLRSRLASRVGGGIGNYCAEKRPYAYASLPSTWKGRLVLDGYWQSERYFEDFSAEILRDFALKDNSWLVEDPLARQIMPTENSVFLHVRTYKEVPGKEDGRCARQMVNYYRNALAYLAAKVPKATVFVFSDDVDWARQNILTKEVLKGISFPIVYNAGGGGYLRDFMLMRMCQHGIVADSSFSWWAGWFGEQARLMRGESALRLHINRRTMNDDYWPTRWIAIEG